MIENRRGRKRIRIYVHGQRRRFGSVATDAEAASAEADALEQRDASAAVTLATFAPAWFDRRELDGVRTVNDERARWRIHVEGSCVAGVALELLTPALVERWVRELQAKTTTMRYRAPRPLSPKTVREIVGLVRMALDAAGVSPNPVAQARKVVRAATRRRGEAATVEPWSYLEHDEQARLLDCAAVPELERLVIAFALLTGLRQGEQTNLELVDLRLDVEAPHVVVRFGGFKKPKGKPGQRMPPKNGKIRRVYLTSTAQGVARRWLDLLPTWAPENPHGLVFPTRGGSRCSTGKHPLWCGVWEPKTATRPARARKVDGFKVALAAAGLRAVRWHDLRHTCASSLVAGWWGRRWTLEEVREHLGHTSIQSTMRYAHLAESAIKRAIAATTWGAIDTAPVGSTRPELSPVNPRNCSVGREGLEPSTNGLKAPFGDLTIARETKAIERVWGLVGGRLVAALAEGHPLAARVRAALDAMEAGDPFAAPMLARLLDELADGAARGGEGAA